MYPYLFPGDTQTASLEQDDKSGLSVLYSEEEFSSTIHGSISGRVTLNAKGIFGANIVAYDGNTPVASTISMSDGVYRLLHLPTGTYTLRVQHLSTANVTLEDVTTAFQSQYYISPTGQPALAGLASEASEITVLAGRRRANHNLALRPIASPDFFEPDNSPAQSPNISADGTRRIYQFYMNGDQDWVSFQGLQGMNYRIRTDNLNFGADPRLTLYAADGTTVLASNDDLDRANGNLAAAIGFTAPSNGTYYVQMTDARGKSGAQTSFELTLQAVGKSSGLDANRDGSINCADLFLLSESWMGNLSTAKGLAPIHSDPALLLSLLDALHQE
jgi:hypothetical protein